MGKWVEFIDKTMSRHEHDYPNQILLNENNWGSIWKCNCGQKFVFLPPVTKGKNGTWI